MKLIMVIAFVFSFLGCEDNPSKKMDEKTVLSITSHQWNALNGKKIFFGHQSVGNNILGGVRNVMNTASFIKLNIVKTKYLRDFMYPVLGHAKIGKNEDPYSKCDDFASIIEKNLDGQIDAALMKFCYIDIDNKTDINKLFSYYVETISRLHSKYPHIKFLHIAVPLMSKPKGVKNYLKSIFFRFKDSGNINRCMYNRMLLNKYGNDAFFDLAKYESTAVNGRKYSTLKNDQVFLLDEYTDDGGHLNSIGSEIIAIEFLKFLTDNLK